MGKVCGESGAKGGAFHLRPQPDPPQMSAPSQARDDRPLQAKRLLPGENALSANPSAEYDATIVRLPNETSQAMLSYDFHNSVGFWLCITATAMQEALNEELSRHGITYRQFQVLGWLVHDGDAVTQADLAARMRIEPPTLVGLLDRMEQQGWIARVNCPGDRRKKLVRIAPAAEEVWEMMVAALVRVREQATAQLTAEQVEVLKEMLRTIHATLTSPANRPVAVST